MTQAERIAAEAAERVKMIGTVKIVLDAQLTVLRALGLGEGEEFILIKTAARLLDTPLSAAQFELADAQRVIAAERMDGRKHSVSAETDADTRRDERNTDD